jgi:hypothetical protein
MRRGGSLSITEVNAPLSDGVQSKRELPEGGGRDEREEQKMQKMSGGDVQRMFLETPSLPSLQLDDDEVEFVENPSELEKKRGRNEENKEEQEEKLKQQRVQNADEPLQESGHGTCARIGGASFGFQ